MKLTGLWWWIDRWRKSTAYTDMTLEEQGAYRNLLDEASLRGGPLPNDERILGKACGDALAWKRVRPAVMAHFELHKDGWHNETLDEVNRASAKRVEKQQRYRDKRGHGNGNGSGNASGNEVGNASGNEPGNEQGYPDPDPDPDPDPGSGIATRARGQIFAGTRLRVSERQHEVVVAELGTRGKLLDWDALYAAWDADLVESGEAFDALPYVKQRAHAVLNARRSAGPSQRQAGPDWFDECQELHGGECGGQLRHHNRKLIDDGKADLRRQA